MTLMHASLRYPREIHGFLDIFKRVVGRDERFEVHPPRGHELDGFRPGVGVAEHAHDVESLVNNLVGVDGCRVVGAETHEDDAAAAGRQANRLHHRGRSAPAVSKTTSKLSASSAVTSTSRAFTVCAAPSSRAFLETKVDDVDDGDGIDSLALEAQQGHEPDGSGTQDRRPITQDRAAALHRVDPDRERLDEGRSVVAHAVGNLEAARGRVRHVFGEGAVHRRRGHEHHIGAEVVAAGLAVPARETWERRARSTRGRLAQGARRPRRRRRPLPRARAPGSTAAPPRSARCARARSSGYPTRRCRRTERESALRGPQAQGWRTRELECRRFPQDRPPSSSVPARLRQPHLSHHTARGRTRPAV